MIGIGIVVFHLQKKWVNELRKYMSSTYTAACIQSSKKVRTNFTVVNITNVSVHVPVPSVHHCIAGISKIRMMAPVKRMRTC